MILKGNTIPLVQQLPALRNSFDLSGWPGLTAGNAKPDELVIDPLFTDSVIGTLYTDSDEEILANMDEGFTHAQVDNYALHLSEEEEDVVDIVSSDPNPQPF